MYWFGAKKLQVIMLTNMEKNKRQHMMSPGHIELRELNVQ